MFPFHSDFSREQFSWAKLRLSPILWLLAIITIVHLIAFIPAYYSQASFHEQSEKFKEVWNTGGAMSLAVQGIDPTPQQEVIRRHAYIATYIDHNFFYNIWMTPAWVSPLSFAFSWILQPGWFSLLLAIWVLAYAGLWLERYWKRSFAFLLVVGASIVASAIYFVLMSSILERYPDSPFCGISAGVALIVGALVRLHRDEMPFRYWWRGWKSKSLHPFIFALIWFALDLIIQLYINPINYGWAFFLDLIAAGVGIGIAPLIPRPPVAKTTRKFQVNPAEQIRLHLNEGWHLCEILELEAALLEFSKAITMMLRASEPDSYLVENTFTRLLQGKNPLPISPELWYEWGSRLAETKFPRYAIECMEQAYKSSGATIDLARPAVVQSAELRIQHRLDPASSRPWLERVVKHRNDDLMGRRAAKLLEQIG